MRPWITFSLFGAILILSLPPRLSHLDRSLDTDEADYFAAMTVGFRANYLDDGNTASLRHRHPPFATYLQILSTRFLGRSEAAFRFSPLLSGLVLIALAFFGTRSLANRRAGARGGLAGLFSMALIAAFPPGIMHAKTAGSHSLTAVVLLASIFLTGTALLSESRRRPWAAGILFGILMATSEYFYLALAGLSICLVLIPNRWVVHDRGSLSVRLRLFSTGAVALLTGLLLWPSGFFRLGSPLGIAYYLHYARGGHPVLFMGETVMHVPWWAYIVWFWRGYPLFLLLLAGGTVGAIFSALGRREAPGIRILSVFTILFLLATCTQHIISPRYSMYAGCLLLVHVSLILERLWRRGGWILRTIVLLCVILAALQGLSVGLSHKPGTVGYRQASAIVERSLRPGDGVLAVGGNIVRHYIPEATVTNYPFGYTEEELFTRIRSGEFRYIILHSSRIVRWPDDPACRWIEENMDLLFAAKDDREKLDLFEYPPSSQ